MRTGTLAIYETPNDSILRADSAVVRVLTLVEDYILAGVAKGVLEFARQASRTDLGLPHIELAVLTFTRGHTETDFIRALRAEEIPLEVVHERHRFDVAAVNQLRVAVDRRKPDLIWSNSVKSHFLVRAARLNRNIPWLAFHHGYTMADWRNLVYNHIDRWSLRAPNRVATVCRAFRADLSRQAGVPIDHIDVQGMPIRPNASVTGEDVSRLRRQLGIGAETQVVLAVGRLSREKGHADLIYAIAKIRQSAPALYLRALILGDGPERARLEELCSELNLTGTVSFLGYRADVHCYYALADVFVLPSHTEGSRNVLLEAMAAGLLVVATVAGGVPEIVSHEKDALLVGRRDVSALARAIVRGLMDRPLRERLGDAARDVLRRHLPEDYFRSMRSILLHTIRSAGKRSALTSR